MLAWKTEGTKLYQQLPTDCQQTLKLVEPLTEPEENRPQQQRNYFTWQEKK
jgi:phenylacetic acid degradation protein